MLKRFLPQQADFFDLFNKSVDNTIMAATEFHAMLLDIKNHNAFVIQIAHHEKIGDRYAQATYKLLYKTFITPFDRNDIHNLTSQLDDILDLINHSAQRFPFYGLKEIPKELEQLALQGVECLQLLKLAISRLHNLNNPTEIIQFCEAIDVKEDEAELNLLAGEKNLFLYEQDFKQFYKLKEIFTESKDVVSRCQDVGNIVKGIVLEYS